MKLYNTPDKKAVELELDKDKPVKIYTCGPTVYDYSHIGNWYTFIRYDLLNRVLLANGYETKWVMNITDVGHLVSDADEGEDKLEKGAKREGKSAWDVAKYYGDYFIEGLSRLNFSEINDLPKATDYIDQQLELVGILEHKGFTYVIDDGVYFDTSKLADYAKFANLNLSAQEEGARVEANSQKRNPSDFALWKFSPKGEKRDMEWWSPWPNGTTNEEHSVGQPRTTDLSEDQGGAEQHTETYTKYGEGAVAGDDAGIRQKVAGAFSSAGRQGEPVSGSWGFPGWHLECSAMIHAILGEPIDIHAGGIDHIQIHHTNEIAQSVAAFETPLSRYWMHCNHIQVDGKKMAKSDGNYFTMQDVEEKGYSLEVFRLHVLGGHYRSESQFSWESLDSTRSRLQRWVNVGCSRWQLSKKSALSESDIMATKEHVLRAISADLNSPEALTEIDFIIGSYADHRWTINEVSAFGELLETIDTYLGTHLAHLTRDITDEQKQLIKERSDAKASGDFQKSDDLRSKLDSVHQIILRDTSIGSVWSRSI